MLYHIKTLSTNEEKDIRDLSKKLAMQVAITSANRTTEIQNVNSKHATDTGPTIIFHLETLTKGTKQGQPLTKVKVHSLT